MRIAFQNGTVHKRARVAFIGVAADVLLIRLVRRRKAPLEARREARAAAAAQTGGLHDVNNLLRGHLGEHLTEGLIAVDRDVFIDVLRVDYTQLRSAIRLCLP